jgi:hypothetical protein
MRASFHVPDDMQMGERRSRRPTSGLCNCSGIEYRSSYGVVFDDLASRVFDLELKIWGDANFRLFRFLGIVTCVCKRVTLELYVLYWRLTAALLCAFCDIYIGLDWRLIAALLCAFCDIYIRFVVTERIRNPGIRVHAGTSSIRVAACDGKRAGYRAGYCLIENQKTIVNPKIYIFQLQRTYSLVVWGACEARGHLSQPSICRPCLEL